MVIFHVGALVAISGMVVKIRSSGRFQGRQLRNCVLLVAAVMGVLFVHTFESWVWAAIYVFLGEFEDINQAVYFSVVTSTTLGYGDITLSPEWQLLSSFQSMGGLILFGASTALLIDVMRFFFEEGQQSIKDD